VKYIRPKTLKKKVNWNISEKTLTILSYYSKYSQYSEEEIVDIFTENLLTDKGFIEWVDKLRHKKKIEEILKECTLIDRLEGENQSGEIKETS